MSQDLQYCCLYPFEILFEMLRRRTTSFDAGFLILFNCFAYSFLFVASFFVHFVIHQFLITPTTSDFVFFIINLDLFKSGLQ